MAPPHSNEICIRFPGEMGQANGAVIGDKTPLAKQATWFIHFTH